jgi:uncharacterized protein (DUF2461 family)
LQTGKAVLLEQTQESMEKGEGAAIRVQARRLTRQQVNGVIDLFRDVRFARNKRPLSGHSISASLYEHAP